MIRARVWSHRNGHQTVRCWVPRGELHRIRLTGPCRIASALLGITAVLKPGDQLEAGPFSGPFSYTVRYG